MTNDTDRHETENRRGATLFPLSLGHLVGLFAMQAASACWLVDPVWSILPLAGFLVLCLVAPFVQRLQFFLPIVTKGDRRGWSVALTFDDGPDPNTTPRLLNLLAERGVKATFFLVGTEVRDHPDLVRRILEHGHEIGNHTYSQDVFLMLRGVERLRLEVEDCQRALAAFGIRPVAFRPPVGVTNSRLWRVLLDAGMYCAGFRHRAYDLGNRRVAGIAGRLLSRVRPGDVLLMHDCSPGLDWDAGPWLREVTDLLDGLEQRGLRTVPLSGLIRRPVMEPLDDTPPDAVRAFYESIAMDEEQGPAPRREAPARRVERDLFVGLAAGIGPEDRVLEVGAGMGRFTLPMARRAREVVAVDISPRSLDILRQRATAQNLGNIRAILADMRKIDLSGPFDLVCSFSSFEYTRDLRAVLRRLVGRLRPGGRLYFITSHCSFFRFFVQVGNAMKQGVWLHARTRREITRMLRSMGMEEISVSTHGMDWMIGGGLLLEASARKAGPR